MLQKITMVLLTFFLFNNQIINAQELKLNEVKRLLEKAPNDSYLQYAVLQLAQRTDRVDEVAHLYPQKRLNLFDMFLSADAMQGILQQETILEREIVIRDQVDIKTLKPLELESIDWQKLLQGKNPEISRISKCIPQNNYFIHFTTLNTFAKALKIVDDWEKPLLAQGISDGMSSKTGDKLQEQLALEFNPELRKLYDRVVIDIAITGSDPFVREGSDVSLVLEYKQNLDFLFKTKMKAHFLQAKSSPGVTTGEDQYMGIPYEFAISNDRKIHFFSAYPLPGVHVRANSKKGLQCIIEAIRKKNMQNEVVENLGETAEFKYARTLFPYQKEEEQGFAYFSSTFFRHLLSPQSKLTERHRVLCYNHLKMIHHSTLLYQSETGEKASSFLDIKNQKCSPGEFGKESLRCPDSGEYSFEENGLFGSCSVHGNIDYMTPCIEITTDKVMVEEAYAYDAFRKNFEPPFQSLVAKLKLDDNKYELETIAMPLMKSVATYQNIWGAAREFDVSPGSQQSIFKISTTLDKNKLIEEAKRSPNYMIPPEIENIILEGLDNKITMQFYDDAGSFPFELLNDLAAFASMDFDTEQLIPLLANFLAQIFFDGTVELSIPIKNEKLVRDFLEEASHVGDLLHKYQFSFFSTLRLPDSEPISYLRVDLRSILPAFNEAPFELWGRLFWTNINSKLYFTTKLSLIDQHLHQNITSENLEAHSILTLYPHNFEPLAHYWNDLWQSNNSNKCLEQRTKLIYFSKIKSLFSENEINIENIQSKIKDVYGTELRCPSEGVYQLKDEKVECSLHSNESGTPSQKVQKVEGDLIELLHYFRKISMAIKIEDYGLKLKLIGHFE